MNKKFSRTTSQLNINRTIHSTSSSICLWEKERSFERRIISNIFQRMPIIIKTLASICQLLDDNSLSEIKLEQIHQATIDCILWNEDRSYPIAIDQNIHLNEFRQSIREFIYEFLEFAQQILIISDKNNQIDLMIEKCIKYSIILNDYRTKRQSAYNDFCSNHTLEDALLRLNNIDKQQYYELRLIGLNLRQFFLKLIAFITPKFAFLE